jgi:hypothetical protein
MTAALGLPLALGLLGLALGPMIAHLVRRQPSARRAFGAMLLLRRMQRRLRRRRRLQDKWLLALRMLIIAAVVAAAAKPELRWPGAIPQFGGTGTVVVVIDNSLSMDLREAGGKGGTLLSRARTEARQLVAGLPPQTLLGAVIIGGSATRLTPALTRDRAAVLAAIDDVAQTQLGTDLVGGLREARRLLGGAGGEIVVFSDEAGPTAVPAALPEIALLTEQGGALVPRPQRAALAANVAVVGAQYGSGPEGGSVRVRVANFGPDAVEVPCTVQLPDGTEITAFVSVGPGQTVEKGFTVPRVTQGGVGVVRIEDGTLAGDDSFAFHLPTVGASRVLVVDGDPGLTPIAAEVYYLERALAPWGSSAAMRGGVLPEVTGPSGISSLDPDEHQVVFLANVADPAPLANHLINFVHNGGSVVIGLGDNVTADRYNGVLASLLPAALRRPRALSGPGELGVPTELPDTSLELFAPFSRGGRTAFGRIRWNQLFTLEPFEQSEEVRTLLSTESGIPVLVERKVGSGRVLLMTGTFDTGWTNLPLQAAFMPWIQSMVRYLGGRAATAGELREVRVGDVVEIALPVALADVTVTGPRGAVPIEITPSGIRFHPLQAGAYTVESPGAPALAVVAANVDPAESDVRLGPALAETAAQVDPERFMHRFPLLPWLLWAALGFGLIQAALAFRRPAEAEEEMSEPQHAS